MRRVASKPAPLPRRHPKPKLQPKRKAMDKHEDERRQVELDKKEAALNEKELSASEQAKKQADERKAAAAAHADPVVSKLALDIGLIHQAVVDLRARQGQPITPADLDPIEHSLNVAANDTTKLKPITTK